MIRAVEMNVNIIIISDSSHNIFFGIIFESWQQIRAAMSPLLLLL